MSHLGANIVGTHPGESAEVAWIHPMRLAVVSPCLWLITKPVHQGGYSEHGIAKVCKFLQPAAFPVIVHGFGIPHLHQA